MRANKTFSGGYHFKFEGYPRAEVVEMEIPSTVIIPLKQGCGNEVKPVVKQGDKVEAGQIIGKDAEGIAAPVHASVSGEVVSLDQIKYPRGVVNSIVIESDGTKRWEPLAGRQADWTKLSVPQIEELLYTSGVTSLDSQGIPTNREGSPLSARDVKHLIVNAVEADPYNLSLTVLLAEERLVQFLEGLMILQKMMPGAKIHLAVNSNRKELLAQFDELTRENQLLELYPLSPKYPQGNDEVLMKAILGGNYANASAASVVLTVQTVLQARDAVVDGKPLIERMVALSGPGWEHNLHLKVRVGTPIQSITAKYLKKTGLQRLVPNNLLTNVAISDLLPVDRTFDNLNAIPENTNRALFSFLRLGAKKSSYSKAFLSAALPMLEKTCDTNVHGEARACIFCGYCEEVCPVEIIPHLLDKYVKSNIIDEQLIRYGIFSCVECNLCSYVCPSKIHLAWNIKAGQQMLIENEFKQPQPAQCGKDAFAFHFAG
ncbi:MAG: 4Fe-4S dicluster domain-containing protein [Dethiobacter sp.]|jgi:Na(+)-translocating NADH:ubiquinone oxidoreductase A subunit|nr:4Fe-4S dicluster domain-containing protein [Dethiobacter sp.]